MALDAPWISAFRVLGGALFPHGVTIDTSVPIQKVEGNTANDPVKIRLFADIFTGGKKRIFTGETLFSVINICLSHLLTLIICY